MSAILDVLPIVGTPVLHHWHDMRLSSAIDTTAPSGSVSIATTSDNIWQGNRIGMARAGWIAALPPLDDTSFAHTGENAPISEQIAANRLAKPLRS